VLTAEEKKLFAADKRIVVAAEFIGLFSGSKNPRRQRLGILLQTLRLLQPQTQGEFAACASQLFVLHAQNLALLSLADAAGRTAAEAAVSRPGSAERIAGLVRPKKSLSLDEASPTSAAGLEAGSYDDQLCCVGRSQQSGDRVLRLGAKQLRDCRVDEDVLFLPSPDKCHFFLRRALGGKQGILKTELDLSQQQRRPQGWTVPRLTEDRRKKILSGVPLAASLQESSSISDLSRVPRLPHAASGKSLSRGGSPQLSSPIKRKSGSVDPSLQLGASFERGSQQPLPAIRQSRSIARMLGGVPAKPLPRPVLRR